MLSKRHPDIHARLSSQSGTGRHALWCPGPCWQVLRLFRGAAASAPPGGNAAQVGAFVGAASQLVVWNILTRGTWWTLPLAVSCLAADPAGEHFAAVITNLGSAAEGDDGQSAEAAVDARSTQAVLVFRPESPQPIYSWASRQPLSAALFTQPNTAVHIAAERVSPQVHFRRHTVVHCLNTNSCRT